MYSVEHGNATNYTYQECSAFNPICHAHTQSAYKYRAQKLNMNFKTAYFTCSVLGSVMAKQRNTNFI